MAEFNVQLQIESSAFLSCYCYQTSYVSAFKCILQRHLRQRRQFPPINHHGYTAVGLLAVVSVSTAFASPFPLTYRETRTGRHIPARPDVAGGDATGGGGERGKIAKRRRRRRKIWVCCLGCNTARKHVKRKKTNR